MVVLIWLGGKTIGSTGAMGGEVEVTFSLVLLLLIMVGGKGATVVDPFDYPASPVYALSFVIPLLLILPASFSPDKLDYYSMFLP